MAGKHTAKKSWRRPASMRWHARLTTWFLYRILIWMRDKKGVKVHVQGKKNVPLEGGVVLAGGHYSIADPVVVMGALAKTTRYRVGAFLSMYELFRWRSPHTAILARLMGHIPVQRNTKRAARAKVRGLNVLRHGGMLGGFPGGACDSVPREKKYAWRRGLAEMAIECQVPIVMFRLINTARFVPLGPDSEFYGGKVNWDTELTVIFSMPILPEHYEGMTAEELTTYMEEVHDNLEYIPVAAA